MSVYENLLFMSVEMPNGRLDCGVQGFPPEPPPAAGHEKERRLPAAQKDRFRGVRIFDISDIKNPKQVAAVQPCRGSHTHTLVQDPNDKENVYIYVSGTSFVRQAEELAGCSGEKPDKDPNTALFRIEVIKVPVAAPQDAKVVSSPRLFIDPRTGALNGLNNGGTHGKGGEKPEDTNQCHDITVYPAIGLAAGACSGNGIVLDIKDPVHPKRVDAVNDPNYRIGTRPPSRTTGSKVVFTDEWGGGGRAVPPERPNKWGADAIFSLKEDKLSFAKHYKLPAAPSRYTNCVAQQLADSCPRARYRSAGPGIRGGPWWTSPTQRIIRMRRTSTAPIDPKMLVLAASGRHIGTTAPFTSSEIARGLDVFELTPSKFLTQNEIDAAKTVRVPELNVQNQQKIAWPAQLIVAKAYLDQLQRSQALPASRIADLRKAIQSAESSHMSKGKVKKLEGMAPSLEKSAAASSPTDAARLHALADILKHPSA